MMEKRTLTTCGSKTIRVWWICDRSHLFRNPLGQMPQHIQWCSVVYIVNAANMGESSSNKRTLLFFFMGFEYLSGGKSLGFYGLHLFFLGGLHNQPTGYPAMMSARPWLPRPKRRKPGSTNVARLKLRRTSSHHLQLFALVITGPQWTNSIE